MRRLLAACPARTGQRQFRSANPDDTLRTIHCADFELDEPLRAVLEDLQQWCPWPARLVSSKPIINGDEFTRLHAPVRQRSRAERVTRVPL